ncbi:hypothetical protein [Parvibaculum sp.]|uniref:hypothetical protein n=1 Tax=Parvibaculum sp. TaxID=2024848 RepID=UPI002735728C|nr:hypothetical protein [Parvibaculum sp.]MDP3327205.1 hypothetical protein [Parvibaculum sp.]
MARLPSQNDFVVTVDGIGVFTFAKKGMRDQFAIEAEYSRLTEGVETVTDFLWSAANSFANLKVLTVSAPDGWNLEGLDPDDSNDWERLTKVWSALRDKQLSFRKAAQEGGEKPGARPPKDDGVLVPKEVQPGSD